MLRRGFELEPKPEDEHPLFGKTAQAHLRAIEISDVWLGLRAGLEAQREALLGAPLQGFETLETRWGAIQQLTLLLHGGPQMILQYTQLAASSQTTDETPEYNPNVHTFEGR